MPSEKNTGGSRRRKEVVNEFDSEDDQDVCDILDKPTSSGELGAKKRKAVRRLPTTKGRQTPKGNGNADVVSLNGDGCRVHGVGGRRSSDGYLG